MRIIKRSTLRAAWEKHPDAKDELVRWFKVAEAAPWGSILEVRQTFAHADGVTLESGHTVTVFNVRGNRYRLIVAIHYNTQLIFIREFLTHAEYDKGEWKTRN